MKKKLTKLLALLLSLLAITCFSFACVTPQHTHEYVNNICECGEYDPTYYTEGLVFTPFGEGYSVKYIGKEVTDIVIPSIYNGKPVINIGGNEDSLASFGGIRTVFRCENIIIPNSISTIKSDVIFNVQNFNEENGLRYLGNPKNLYHYLVKVVDRNIATVEINPNCKIIGSFAIVGCDSLTEIKVPDGVISIGKNAFGSCKSLQNLIIPESVEFLGGSPFIQCDAVECKEENGLKYLGNPKNPYLYLVGAVDVNITTAEINPNCKIVGYRAFAGCVSLSRVVLPDSITNIASYAFDHCTVLENIVIPNGVTTIGCSAFESCNALTSVKLPDSVTNIGFGAFMNCAKLNDVVLGKSEMLIDHYAFAYCPSLKNVSIPRNVTGMGKSVFFYCKDLTIKCEVDSQPSEWDKDWNESACPVVWGYKG